MEKEILSVVKKILGNKLDVDILQSNNGVSTNVFKILRGSEVFYFRMSFNSNTMMSQQVLAHELLLKSGVKVPEVVAWEDSNPDLGKSFMLVKEIPGIDLQTYSKSSIFNKSVFKDILFSAGEDLKRVTSIRLESFGRINIEIQNVNELTGRFKSNGEFMLYKFNEHIAGLKKKGFRTFISSEEILKYFKLVNANISKEPAVLAHGDFSLDHIYIYNGKYSGVIDWGDITAAADLYDIAHFSGKSYKWYEYLLKGFYLVEEINEEVKLKILLTRISILIGKLNWIGDNLPMRFGNDVYRERILKDLDILRTIDLI